jgi:hypothetical protein
VACNPNASSTASAPSLSTHRPSPCCCCNALQIEFPSAGLQAAQGDGDGQNEMNWSMGYLRQYLNAFQDQAAGIRVFFPDNIVSETLGLHGHYYKLHSLMLADGTSMIVTKNTDARTHPASHPPTHPPNHHRRSHLVTQ